MSTRRWGVQNRPKAIVVQGALYGFLTTATITGGVVAVVILDRARVWRNARRLARAAQ